MNTRLLLSELTTCLIANQINVVNYLLIYLGPTYQHIQLEPGISDEAVDHYLKTSSYHVTQLLINNKIPISYDKLQYCLNSYMLSNARYIKLLLDSSPQLSSDLIENSDAIDRCIISGFYDTAKLLLENIGIENYLETSDWSKPFTEGIKKQKNKVIELLLDYLSDHEGMKIYIFGTACEYGNTKVMQLALERGVDPKHIYKYVLVNLIVSGEIQTLKMLFDHGLKITARWEYLSLARSNSLEKLQLFLDYGVDIHAYEELALYTAYVEGFEEMAQMLIDSGANLDVVIGQFKPWIITLN